MKFYSGFSLRNDKHFFKDYIKESEYTVSGFSYGAIKAFEHVKEQLKNRNRVDTLQLFSPVFFQSKSSKFKRLQTLAYVKNKDAYLIQFIDGCFSPYEIKDIEHSNSSVDELEELLTYEWVISELLALVEKGVVIEVYLGEKDKITDAKSAKEFFLSVSTVTYIKDANHFLQTF